MSSILVTKFSLSVAAAAARKKNVGIFFRKILAKTEIKKSGLEKNTSAVCETIVSRGNVEPIEGHP